jgi:hypothetical protein
MPRGETFANERGELCVVLADETANDRRAEFASHCVGAVADGAAIFEGVAPFGQAVARWLGSSRCLRKRDGRD